MKLLTKLPTPTETLQELMKLMGRSDLGIWVNEVYYKEKELYFQTFVQAVRDILDGDMSQDILDFIFNDDGLVTISLADICEQLNWPIRYARKLLLDVMDKVSSSETPL